jgi:hypothetical protein
MAERQAVPTIKFVHDIETETIMATPPTPRFPGDLGPIGARVGANDVLDAAVGAWTARRYTEGVAVSYPDPPIQYSDGWPCAICACRCSLGGAPDRCRLNSCRLPNKT